MINFIKDLINYFKLKKKEKNCEIGFFCESEFIFQYLFPHIERKLKKKILIISFENFKNDNLRKDIFFVFKTNFFRELVFLTLNIKFLYSSTPDLNNTVFKRSKLHKCKYIYLQHTPVSLTMIYNENAFDNFDAIQVISEFQYNEMLEIKKRKKLKIKIFKSKYLFVEKQIEDKKNRKIEADLLIAPSWNSSFYKLECHKILRDLLIKTDVSFKIRPHPMSYLKQEISKQKLKNLDMQIDDSKFINFNRYNFFISDWSGLFIEYTLIYKRKSFLINTHKKIVNKNYLDFKTEPIEISLRDKFCNTYEIKNIKELVNDIKFLKEKLNSPKFNEEDAEVKKIIEENFY